MCPREPIICICFYQLNKCTSCRLYIVTCSLNTILFKYSWEGYGEAGESFIFTGRILPLLECIPDSKVHGANIGPTWVLSSHITGNSTICSTVFSGTHQRNPQSSAALAFVRGIHRSPVQIGQKGQMRGKCFHLMASSWTLCTQKNIFE